MTIQVNNVASTYEEQGKQWPFLPPGTIVPYAGFQAEGAIIGGWLRCNGQAVSRTTYADLFAAIAPAQGGVTMDYNTDIFTNANGGFTTGFPVFFTTSNTLPAPLQLETLYYVIYASATTFKVASGLALAYAGTALNLTSAGLGTHKLYLAPFGIGDGYSTFNVPDLRGRAVIGRDNMGGTSINRVTDAEADVMGGTAGEEHHVLTEAEMPSHTHDTGLTRPTSNTYGTSYVQWWTSATAGASYNRTSTSAGSDGAHNNMPPYMAMNYIIKT